jgi:hypothetical protein
MSLVKKLVVWALVCCASGLAFLLLFELAARVVMPEHVANLRKSYFFDTRISFISPGAFQNKAGYSAFRPNSAIREVAMYPDRSGKLTLEYDCSYRSDALGFVSNEIAYENAEVLLLGDSLAQGVGGCSWMERLSPPVRSRIYSAAVLGHGVLNWNEVVAELETIKKPGKILIIFITHDFVRPQWMFDTAQIECLQSKGSCAGKYWYPIDERMLETATARYREKIPTSSSAPLRSRIKYHFIASYEVYSRLFGQGRVASDTFGPSVDAIHSLAKRYDVRLIWVNDRWEADRPTSASARLLDRLSALNVQRCRIPPDGFLPRDGHPNAQGYDALVACVEKAVRDW